MSKIMVVNDKEDIITLFTMALEKEGYQVVGVTSGEECLNRLKRENPDLILLDIMMPRMDGIEVLKRVRKIAPDIDCIMVTAHASVDSAVTAMRYGASGYILKPLNVKEIIIKVKKALRERELEFKLGESEEKYRDELETRVRERTAELSKANEQLQQEITERKRVEGALGESEEKFRTLAEKSPNMIFINKKGRVIFANEKCEEVMGYKREEFYSPDFDFLTLIAEEHQGLIMQNFQKHQKGEEIPPYEYTLVTKKGKRIEALQTNRLIKYEGETAIIGIITDITERKKAEEELQESEEKYRNLFENANDSIFITDPKTHRLLDANANAAKRLGYSREELLQLPIDDIMPSVPVRWIDSIITPKLQEYNSKVFETTQHRKNGSEMLVEISSQIIEYNGRKVIQSFIRDITERKRVEEALRESEERHRTLIESSTDAIISINEEGVITLWNEITENIFGYSKSEALGKSVTLIIPWEDRDMRKKSFARFLRYKKLKLTRKRYEADGLRKDGSRFPIEFSLTCELRNGHYTFTAILRDVTDRKKMEQRLIDFAKNLGEKVEQRTKELKETKDFLQNVVDSTGKMIFSLDKKRHISSWNRGAELITGYKQKDVGGKGLSEFRCFDVGEMAERMDESLEKVQIDDFETAVKSKEGRRKVLSLSISQLKDREGVLLGFVVMGRDVTLSRRMNEILIPGNSYLIKAKSSIEAYSILEGLTSSGFNGLVVTRTNPANIRSTYKLDASYLWMSSEKSQDFESMSEFPKVVKKVRRFISENPKGVILIDRIDYLITIHDFREFLTSVYRLNELISVSNSIMIVNATESVLTPQQLNLLEQEIQMLPRLKADRVTELSYDLYELLSFVHDNEDVRLKDISGRFSITRPTVNKRVKILEKKGLIDIVANGRTKVLKITEPGIKSL